MDLQPFDRSEDQPALQINFKRVVARAVQYWYMVVLSLVVAVIVTFLINRYSEKVYQIRASIMVRQSEENAGANFLYNNELISPYRNYFNEIYIMKSYPLLQEVMESLGFQVSYFREGDIKTTEFYDADFPVRFNFLQGSRSINGTMMIFRINSDSTFSLQHKSDKEGETGKEFSALPFNDTIQVNGFKLLVESTGRMKPYIGERFVIQLNDALNMAKKYSSKLLINWAQQGASVVNLEIQGGVPQKEINFLNKFIERYQHYDVEKKNKMATMAIRFLDEQLVVTGDSLDRYESEVEAFKEENIIVNLSEETNRLYLKLQGFEGQKFNYRLQENYFKYITELLNTNQYDGIFTPSSVGITDEIVAGLISRLITYQNDVKIYKSNVDKGLEKLEENPALQSKLKMIEFIKADILRTIENTNQTNKINIEFINDQIKLVEDQLAKLPGTERELIDIRRNYSLKENLYIFLLQKRTEAGLSRASTTSDIVVINPPMTGALISPKPEQNYAIALAVALFLPALVFLLQEMFNNRVQAKEDIDKVASVPFIGALGHNSQVDKLVVYTRPRSAMSESFRALRSNLNYFTGNKGKQVFMITSSIPGEGKSFTALNLSCVFALAGKKTLIMGADLRKPKLYDELGLQNTVGLSQYLSGMAKLDEIIQVSKIDNLSLIAGGPMPPNPSELLLKPEMKDLMTDLKQRYDYIIMDTPPLMFVTDAFVLSEFSDHTIFIVRQDFTPKAALVTLNEYYTTGKFQRVSILFNDIRRSGLGYGYEGYGYGYGYGYNYGYGYGRKKKSDGPGYYEGE